jgi:hypothetical protein
MRVLPTRRRSGKQSIELKPRRHIIFLTDSNQYYNHYNHQPAGFQFGSLNQSTSHQTWDSSMGRTWIRISNTTHFALHLSDTSTVIIIFV